MSKNAFVGDSIHFLLISFFASLLKEEQRPVLTIVILVAGVVGGLVVVITVVYFYRFCLKKRPPVTTTGKPEHKRDQIRSQAASQCRPLPLPPVIAKPSFSVPSHYQSCMPQLEPTSLQSPDKRTAINIGEPDSADKTAKLFPSNFSVTVTTAVGEKKEPPSYKNDRSNQAKGNYLTVDGIPPRPQSAETMLRVAEDEERRRASLDAYHRHIRRQLPNIEHLEQQQATYLRGTTPPRRHISELPKSAAIALHYPPRKQTSSPLPEVKQHRIYDRGHVFSKSWNPERYICYETPPDVDSDASVPTQIDDYGLDPYKKFYHEMMRVFGSDARVNELPQDSATAVVDRLNIRPFSKQTKSLDDRQPKRRATVMTPRSLSEAEQRQLVRQQTVFHLQPQNQISKECLNLWADRKMLELSVHLANQTSTDLSTDQSASTSFESNTEPTAPERRYSSFLELPHSADIRRQKYRSLLLHRQQLSNAMQPQASSFESALSSESSAADSATANGVGTASFDSTRSEQTDQDKAPESKLCRQLSESQEEKRSPISLRRECSGRPRPAPYVPLARRIIGKKVARSLQRDYSVDSKTDRIFKEFVKVDPDFETGPSGRNAGHGRLLPEYNGFGRHRTVDISDISQHMTIPLICFPEEQTMSR